MKTRAKLSKIIKIKVSYAATIVAVILLMAVSTLAAAAAVGGLPGDSTLPGDGGVTTDDGRLTVSNGIRGENTLSGVGTLPGDDGGARNIYVGDIITLEISAESAGDGNAASDITADKLAELFGDFEIIEIRKQSGWFYGPVKYIVSLRTFEPGEYTVRLQDKEIVVNVASTLDDIQRDDVFEGGGDVAKPPAAIPWRSLAIASAVIFTLSGGYVLFKKLFRKKTSGTSPKLLFLRRAGALSSADESFLADLTRYFKDYLEAVFRRRIIGKTSAEIAAEIDAAPWAMSEMSEMSEMSAVESISIMADIRGWLKECDRLKFTGIKTPNAGKEELYMNLINLVMRMDAIIQRTDEKTVDRGAVR